MKKFMSLGLVLFLSGCGSTSFSEPDLAQKITEFSEREKGVLNLMEIYPEPWENLRILHPYEQTRLFGQEYRLDQDTDCRWVFFSQGQVVEDFSMPRSTLDCVDLPTDTFARTDSIFLMEDRQLKPRKKFQLPK
jgi:hypothetical protein